MSASDLADLIHENKFDCADPKSGKGRDCESCRDLAEKIVNVIEKKIEVPA